MRSPLVPFLSLALAVAMFFIYVDPLWNGPIANAKAAIKADNQALAAAAQYKAQEETLVQQANALDQTSLAKLENLLPDSVNNVRIILDLNALAARSGLAISSINVAQNQDTGQTSASGGTSPDASVGDIDMTLSATGSYQALFTFLKGIELSERLLDVRSLTVSGSNTGVYTYQMTIRLYWLH